MRHVHSLELNHKFLIIGLTGPLRSGCTTVAKFMSEGLIEEAKKFADTSEDGQRKIEVLYNNLKYAVDEGFDVNKIDKTKNDLYYQLKLREVKDILASKLTSGIIKQFTHISMSMMLLKYAIEYHLEHEGEFYDASYSHIIDKIIKSNFDKNLVRDVNEIITGKKYRDLTKDLCKSYDEYLNKISYFYENLKKIIEPNILGNMMQDIGDNIRRGGTPFRKISKYSSGNVILIAEQANKFIKYYRNRQDDDKNRKHHFVIESFRNPYEVEYFRCRYYEFYLISMYADRKVRQTSRGMFSKERDDRDSGSDKKAHELYKQDVAKCVHLSDIAVNNDGTFEKLWQTLLYYYALILQPGCVTPFFNEVFMNEAYALSLKSSCISRQVGAVIIGQNGYMVGAGWNEAGEGQVGCGYRQVQDVLNLKNDVLVTTPPSEHRHFRILLQKDKELSDPFCFKDDYSSMIMNRKISKLITKHTFNKLITNDDGIDIEKLFSDDLKVKRLEYCRALHAEENALLQSSKIGGTGVKGGKIFTTSFPCELCAKKIYQSGIVEIIYTEPYPDSISQTVILKDGIRRIKLTQFEGVKSHSYFRLYKGNMDRKEMIEICRKEKSEKDEAPNLFNQ